MPDFAAVMPDMGALIRSGMAIVPDYAAASERHQQLANQTLQAETQANQEQRLLAHEQRGIARQQGFEGAFSTWLQDPTMDGMSRLMAAYPEYHAQAQKVWETRQADARQRDQTQLGEVFGALVNGQPDLAIKTVETRRTADLQAGKDTSDEDALLEMLRSDDPEEHQRARGMIAYELANSLGPDHFAAAIDKLNVPPAEEYARSLGLRAGTDEYRNAIRDYVLRGSGPTAHGYDVDLEAVRQDNRQALVRERARNRPPPAKRNPNVIERIREKIANGAPLSAGEQKLWGQYSSRVRGGGKKPATDSAIAVNPKTGEKLILRDGRWVPLK
jgi:hypothetical protein